MTHEFKVGDWCRVDLPHSPTMQVVEVTEDYPGMMGELFCRWFDAKGRLQNNDFLPEHLIPVSRDLAELQCRGEPVEEAPMEGG